MAANKIRGRPSKLTPELADRLVALLAGGATITSAAATIGVDRRTIQQWRARAYSRDPRNRPHVELEQRVQAARVEAAAAPAAALAPVEDWEEAAARLEEMNPFRWGPVASLDDVLGAVGSLDEVLGGS
jgi:hypothetical protein